MTKRVTPNQTPGDPRPDLSEADLRGAMLQLHRTRLEVEYQEREAVQIARARGWSWYLISKYTGIPQATLKRRYSP